MCAPVNLCFDVCATCSSCKAVLDAQSFVSLHIEAIQAYAAQLDTAAVKTAAAKSGIAFPIKFDNQEAEVSQGAPVCVGVKAAVSDAPPTQPRQQYVPHPHPGGGAGVCLIPIPILPPLHTARPTRAGAGLCTMHVSSNTGWSRARGGDPRSNSGIQQVMHSVVQADLPPHIQLQR
jgi:hypothetical protein